MHQDIDHRQAAAKQQEMDLVVAQQLLNLQQPQGQVMSAQTTQQTRITTSTLPNIGSTQALGINHQTGVSTASSASNNQQLNFHLMPQNLSTQATGQGSQALQMPYQTMQPMPPLQRGVSSQPMYHHSLNQLQYHHSLGQPVMSARHAQQRWYPQASQVRKATQQDLYQMNQQQEGLTRMPAVNTDQEMRDFINSYQLPGQAQWQTSSTPMLHNGQGQPGYPSGPKQGESYGQGTHQDRRQKDVGVVQNHGQVFPGRSDHHSVPSSYLFSAGNSPSIGQPTVCKNGTTGTGKPWTGQQHTQENMSSLNSHPGPQFSVCSPPQTGHITQHQQQERGDSSPKEDKLLGPPVYIDHTGKIAKREVPSFITMTASQLAKYRDDIVRADHKLKTGESNTLVFIKFIKELLQSIRQKMENSGRSLYYGQVSDTDREHYLDILGDVFDSVEEMDQVLCYLHLSFESSFSVVMETAATDTRSALKGEQLKNYNAIRKEKRNLQEIKERARANRGYQNPRNNGNSSFSPAGTQEGKQNGSRKRPASAAGAGGTFRGKCNTCQEIGHVWRNCPKK